MKLDSLTREEKELCDYMLENALDDDEDENDLLRKMKAYYSEYSNLARRKSNDVLNYFKQRINDSVESRNETIAKTNDSLVDADKLLRKLRKEFEKGDILADDELETICKQSHINTSAIQDLICVGKLKEHGSNAYMIKDTSINDDDESQFELELKRAIERNSKKFSSDIKPSVANKVAKKLGCSIGYTTQSKEYLHKYLYILDTCDNKMLIDGLTRAYKKQIKK